MQIEEDEHARLIVAEHPVERLNRLNGARRGGAVGASEAAGAAPNMNRANRPRQLHIRGDGIDLAQYPGFLEGLDVEDRDLALSSCARLS